VDECKPLYEGNAVAVYESLREAKSEVVPLRKPIASGDTKVGRCRLSR